MKKKPTPDSSLRNVESQCLGGFHANPGFIKTQKASSREGFREEPESSAFCQEGFFPLVWRRWQIPGGYEEEGASSVRAIEGPKDSSSGSPLPSTVKSFPLQLGEIGPYDLIELSFSSHIQSDVTSASLPGSVATQGKLNAGGLHF